jgi:hypothetical protein
MFCVISATGRNDRDVEKAIGIAFRPRTCSVALGDCFMRRDMSGRASLLSTTMLSGLVGAFFLAPTIVPAADLRVSAATAPSPVAAQPFAVDGFNVKLDGLGGSIANRSLYGSQGAVAIPLGQFGLQMDGAAGNFDNRFFGSTAGHAFWRNPAVGLAGFYSSYTQWNSIVGNVHVAKYGGEGALYLGQWTAEGAAGVESGSNRTATVGTFIDTINVKTRFFDQVSLAYYLNDNLKLSIGHAYTAGRSALTAGGEWSFAAGSGRMASLFAEGRFGEGNNHGVWGGLRIYFGQRDKTLIRRNREDDPVMDLPSNLFPLIDGFGQTSVPKGPTTPTCPPGEVFFGGVCVFPV